MCFYHFLSYYHMEVVSCFTNMCVYQCKKVTREILLKQVFNDYFKNNYEISSSIKEEEFYAVVNWNRDSAEDIVQFDGRYM